MPENDYNYAAFNLQAELGKFEEFENHPLHAGRRASDFPAEDLPASLKALAETTESAPCSLLVGRTVIFTS